MTSSPIRRGGGRAFPNKPEENFTHKVNKKMYRAAMATIIFAVSFATAVWPWSTFADRRHAQDQATGHEVQGHGPESVLVITGRNRREPVPGCACNPANVLVVEPRYADPLSLVSTRRSSSRRPQRETLKEMLA